MPNMETIQNANLHGVLAGDPALDIIDTSDGDGLLQTTQKTRLRLIAKMTAQSGYAEDPKIVGQVLKALDGIDKQTLSLKKIASDEGVGTRQAQATEALIMMFNDPVRLNSIVAGAQSAVLPREGAPEIPDDAETIVYVAGEMDPIGKQEDYDAFMNRMQSTIRGDQE